MRVKINIPSNREPYYYGLKDGNVYDVIREWDDSFDVEGNPEILYRVAINKNWCEKVSNIRIELPEDIW